MEPTRPEESSTLRFHRSFAGFDRRMEVDHPRIHKTRELVRPERKGLKILDLGCAGGYVSRAFTAEHEVWGADGIEDLLDIARANGLKPSRLTLNSRCLWTVRRLTL